MTCRAAGRGGRLDAAIEAKLTRLGFGEKPEEND